MTKRHTRWFFIGGTLLFAAVFLGLTIDSHRQFGRLTNADQITPEVVEGKHVWHRSNCINCHTLNGEGAYYAPDLTKITQQRGEAYLTAFLRNPSQFYSEETHRRLMPNPDLNDDEIRQVIAFLEWVGHVDNQGWPPRPIVVSSGQMAGSTGGAATDAAMQGVASDNPVAVGEALFREAALSCAACHSAQPGVTLAGPSLAGLTSRAAATIASPGYTGEATDAEGYIRESIQHPSAHLVAGANFATSPEGGLSLMPADYATRLDAGQIGALVAYLQSLR
jgi:nitric oxide reductase subunit C